METTLYKHSNNYMTLHNFSLQLQPNEENLAARLQESGIGKVSFRNLLFYFSEGIKLFFFVHTIIR